MRLGDTFSGVSQVECYLRMKHKETTVNILLGLFLLLALAIPFCVVLLAIYAIEPPLTDYLARFGFSKDAVFICLLCLGMMPSAVRYLRKRFWPNAFLCFAIVALAISGSIPRVPDRLGLSMEWMWPLFILFLTPAEERLRRSEFILAGILVSTGVAVNVGLFGSGTLADAVRLVAAIATFAWLALQYRRGRFEALNP